MQAAKWQEEAFSRPLEVDEPLVKIYRLAYCTYNAATVQQLSLQAGNRSCYDLLAEAAAEN